ncbi:beta-1,4-galactosyltransferase 1 [Plakobranchus ocellatus]|uniref:Beta-1,4-galactosyltransferase 1 n=1 Tax=Plakobranchus ocellatus TaxID=259542 RepID=A0AAV4DLZ4_9GAST|nr:beta-1,4-galactosyltransferase 1 [Plakobranchus ocellatus]
MATSWVSCCIGGNKVKVVILLCVMGFLINFLVFMQYRTVNPRAFWSLNEPSSTVKPISANSVPNGKPPDTQHASTSAILQVPHADNNGDISGNEDVVAKGDKPNETPKIVKPEDERQAKSKSSVSQTSTAPNKTLEHLPMCPEKPPELVGRFDTNLNPVMLAAVERKYPEVTMGGHYHPKDCRAREKLAIIIPCRKREQHLYILLNNLLRMLIRQKLDFSIFVIDQDLPTTFNRGMLFNVGFLEALKRDNFDCFILHDVDMVPTNDHCLYKCSPNPRHFLGGLSKWKYGLPYSSYYGGVVSFTRWQYEKINGGSNLYFGWGGEDDDLRSRVMGKGYNMVRYPKEIGRYDTMSHKRDSGNGDNPVRFQLLNKARERQDQEGLRTTKYKVTEITETQLFTRIKVFINMTEILQTEPFKQPLYFQNFLKQAKAFDDQRLLFGRAIGYHMKGPRFESQSRPKEFFLLESSENKGGEESNGKLPPNAVRKEQSGPTTASPMLGPGMRLKFLQCICYFL